MQYKTANERIKKWEAKFSGERQGVLSLLSKPTALVEVRKSFNTAVQDEGQIKAILAEAGTPLMMNPAYHNFGREVRALNNQGLTGAQLIKQADIKLNKYVGYGLDQDTLEKIRNTVYTLEAPTP